MKTILKVTTVLVILFILLGFYSALWGIGDIDRVEDYIDSEITTIDSEVGVIDGIVDNIYLGTYRVARCTAPDGASTTWTQAAHNMFSVVGPNHIIAVVGFCNETLVGAGTIEFGEATGGTDLLLDQVANATTLAGGDIWCGVTADVVLPLGAIGAGESYAVGTCTLELVVGTADITDGQLAIMIIYLPLPSGFSGVTSSIDSVAWD